MSRLSRSETVDLTGQLPHPFFFDRPRAVDGTGAGVAREETALHVHARWGIPVSQSVEVALFGGPTFFSVSQAFVTGIDFDQAYPYDTATLTGAMTRAEDGSTIGFNVGADVSVYFSRWLGVGGLIRFSRSEVDLGDRPTTIAVGGLHTAAGAQATLLTRNGAQSPPVVRYFSTSSSVKRNAHPPNGPGCSSPACARCATESKSGLRQQLG